MDTNHAYIPELHKAAAGRGVKDIVTWINNIAEPGSINFYPFTTYSESEDVRSMMGFTPVLSRNRHTHPFNSPRFDNFHFIYRFETSSTLFHQVGHF